MKLTIATKRNARSSLESSDLSSNISLEKELEENYIDEEHDLVDEEFLSLQEEKDLNKENVPLELEEEDIVQELRQENAPQELVAENVLQEQTDDERTEVDISDFALCNFVYDKGTKREMRKEFICKIISKNNEELEVSCLRKRDNFFIFPNIPDIATIKSNQIQKKPTIPIEKRGNFFFKYFMDSNSMYK